MILTCLYHGDKAAFDLVQQDLQRSKWLPRKYAHRLAMAVCSCRKNKGLLPGPEEFADIREKLYKIMEDYEANSQLILQTKDFIKECLRSAGPHDYSQFQLMKVLYQAKRGNFTCLTREAISTNKPELVKKAPTRITASQKLLIEKKRKKKLQSAVVKLSMYPGNFRRMESLLGGKMVNIAKKSKGYAQLQNDLNTENMASNNVGTYVKVWGNPETIKTLSNRFAECAKQAQLAIDEARKRRRLRRMKMYDDQCDWYEEDYEYGMEDGKKDQLQDDFALKNHRTHRERSRCLAQKVRVQTSVLDGGHCYQCGKPFTNLKDATSCMYHEGFTVSDQTGGQIWSCCNVKVTDGEDLHSQHTSTGCRESAVHKWRPHAKSSGKVMDKMADTFMRSRVKLNHNARPRFKPKSRRLRRIRPAKGN